MMLHSTVWFSIIILFIHITLVHTTNPTYAPTINPYGSICMQSIHAHCHEALNSFNLTAISYCVETHTSAIEPHCIAVLNKNILSVGDACKWDLVTYCAQQILHPFRSIVCLMEHFDVLSSTCRFEVELAIAPIIPCGKEVSNYCKEKVTIEEAVTCLEEQPVTDLDPLHCLPALQHYDTCKKEPATACILPPPPLPNHPTNTGNQGKSSNDNDNKKQDSSNHKKNKKHKRRHKKKHSSSDTSSSTTSTTARPPQHHALAIIFCKCPLL